ncbi:MAG TPA: hypothetical protein VIK73_04945 [Limnochordales bacterium]
MTTFTIIMAIAAAALTPALPARARAGAPDGLLPDGLRIQSMSLSVRPEYDRPGVLVVYDALVVNESSNPFSGELAFPIPEGAPVPHACEMTRDGDHLSRLPRTESLGALRVVKWALDRELGPGDVYHAFVEFYYDPIEKAGDAKQFVYRFVPLVPIDRLELTLVEPLQATEFRVSPPNAASRLAFLDGQTFKTHVLEFQSLERDQPVQVEVSYRKADDRPSIAAKTGATGSGSSSDTSGMGRGPVDPSLVGMAIVLVGALGLLLYLGVRRSALATRASVSEERRLARQLLLRGRISEATYQQILKDLDREADSR